MPRQTVRLSLLFALILLLPALASAQQSISVNIGYFDPRGEDSRVSGDVLNENLNYHIFDLNDLGSCRYAARLLVFRTPDAPESLAFEVTAAVALARARLQPAATGEAVRLCPSMSVPGPGRDSAAP
jgi:hypothetical protein